MNTTSKPKWIGVFDGAGRLIAQSGENLPEIDGQLLTAYFEGSSCKRSVPAYFQETFVDTTPRMLKVAELRWKELDTWVARSQGRPPDGQTQWADGAASDYSQVQDLIDDEIASLTRCGKEWVAVTKTGGIGKATDIVVASMRAVVNAVFGEEVPDEAQP